MTSRRFGGSARAEHDPNSLFSGGGAAPSPAATGPKLVHHSWVKVKVHNYICRKCGMRKVNIDKPGGYITEWHTPDGDVVELRLSPGCAEGPKTTERLAWLAEWQAQQPIPSAPEAP